MRGFFKRIYSIFGLKDSSGAVINPATSDNQTDKSQMTQITNGTIQAAIVAAADDSTDLEDANGLVTNAVLNGRISDTAIRPLRIDSSTHSIQTMDYEHHKVHDGSHYTVKINKDMANGGTYNIAFTAQAGTKYEHMVFGVEAEVEVDVKVYENITSFTGGTAITPLNNNRNSGNSSGITDMVYDATLTVGSPVEIEHYVLGSNKKSGGDNRSKEEWVLDAGIEYAVLVTNQTASTNEINFFLSWYEHTDKN